MIEPNLMFVSLYVYLETDREVYILVVYYIKRKFYPLTVTVYFYIHCRHFAVKLHVVNYILCINNIMNNSDNS